MRLKDLSLGVFVTVFFSFIYLVVIPMEVPVLATVRVPALSPDFWPKILTICLILLGILQIVYTLLHKFVEPVSEVLSREDVIRVLLVSAIMLAYVVFIPYLGMLCTSIVAMALSILVFGERRPVMVVTLSVLLPVGLQLFFVKVANILIPTGVLPF